MAKHKKKQVRRNSRAKSGGSMLHISFGGFPLSTDMQDSIDGLDRDMHSLYEDGCIMRTTGAARPSMADFIKHYNLEHSENEDSWSHDIHMCFVRAQYSTFLDGYNGNEFQCRIMAGVDTL